MFERFTERARQAVVLAQDEARGFRHNYIGTEHLLLGLLREEDGLAARVLESLEIDLVEVRAQVARIVGRGDEVASGQIPFTPRAKKVLELSLREALSLGHNYIGTEHVLLGLVRENEGVAARILLDLGADAEKIRDRIIQMLSRPRRADEAAPTERTGVSSVTPSRWLYRAEPAQWRFRVEPVSTDDDSELPALLERLGTEGWQLAAALPGPDGANLIFQTPTEPWQGKRRSVSFDTVPPGPTVEELAGALGVPVPAILVALSRLGVAKPPDQPLTDVEIQLLARAFDRAVVIDRPDGPESGAA